MATTSYDLVNLGLRYKSINEWISKDLKTYDKAKKLGLLKYVEDKIRKRKKVTGWKKPKYTLEICIENASKYKSKGLWREENINLYSAACRNQWLTDCNEVIEDNMRDLEEEKIVKIKSKENEKETPNFINYTLISPLGKDIYVAQLILGSVPQETIHALRKRQAAEFFLKIVDHKTYVSFSQMEYIRNLFLCDIETTTIIMSIIKRFVEINQVKPKEEIV